MASRNKHTTSLPSQSDALKPLVQFKRMPWVGTRGDVSHGPPSDATPPSQNLQFLLSPAGALVGLFNPLSQEVLPSSLSHLLVKKPTNHNWTTSLVIRSEKLGWVGGHFLAFGQKERPSVTTSSWGSTGSDARGHSQGLRGAQWPHSNPSPVAFLASRCVGRRLLGTAPCGPTSLTWSKPSCLHGKEKVKPRGRLRPLSPCFRWKSTMQSTM